MEKFQDNSAVKEVLGVQYLRGIAAMLVVMHHLYFENTQLGPFAVKIFFVISGFVMWHTTADSSVPTVTFWRRRITRIVPLYWMFLSILVAIALLAPQYLKTTAITPENVIKSFLFIPHFHVVQKWIAPLLIPGWSLNYEMLFYFIFGIALLVRSQALRVTVVGLLIWSLVSFGLSLDPEGAIAATYTSPDLLLFVDGIALAILYRAPNRRTAIFVLILICVDALTRSSRGAADFDLFECFRSASPVLIVAAALAVENGLRRMPSNILHMIGNASYSIYLSHLFFLRLCEIQWRHLDAFDSSEISKVTYVALAFIVAIVGGVAVYQFIERPMQLFFHQSQIKSSTRSA